MNTNDDDQGVGCTGCVVGCVLIVQYVFVWLSDDEVTLKNK